MHAPRYALASLACCCWAVQAAGAQSIGAPRKPGMAAIDGVVTDTSLMPLSGATISMMGSALRVVTGDNGRFRISELAPGQHIVLARRLGYEPLSVSVQLIAGDTERVSFSLERNTTTLDTVVVAAKGVPSRLDEFETRYRNHLASSAFNRDDIVKVNPIDTWQMLSRVPSVKFDSKGSALIAVSNRGMKIDRTMQAVPCIMSVMIDGIRMGGADGNFDLTRLPPPEDIHGIEVFAGPASIPPQYGGAGNNKMCGLIAIWTR
jgi:hypothetical protein